MTIKIQCTTCDWWDERDAISVPQFCPECHSSIENAEQPNQPEDTISDKV